jgi:hypothetical protein
LDETSGANKLIALEDTEWYLCNKALQDEPVTLLYRGSPSFRPATKSRSEIVVFKAPKVAGQF